MKTAFLTFLLGSMIVLSGCTYKVISNNNQAITGNENNSIQTGDDVQAPLEDSLSGENGEYTLFFDNDSMSKTFSLHHNARQQNNIYFINDGFKKVNVDISLPKSDPQANLRLSLITMPDGSTDGPFGLQTSYDLTQNGGYQLTISESMMA